MISLNRSALIRKEISRPTDRLALLIATGMGVGFAPIAPGTFGSMEGVIIYFAIAAMPFEPKAQMALLLSAGVLLFAIGVWAASRACKIIGLEDPGEIVIDEVSGQLIGLMPLPLAPSVAGVAVAFLLFRLFDILKPYPIYKLERLPSGLGVMSDDALAGIYTAVLIWLALRWGVI